MKTWPADWTERMRGAKCEMCTADRPDDNGFGVRVFAGRQSDAYLQRRDDGQHGYTIVIWRGPHVADLTELPDDTAAAYLSDVLRVGRAIQRHYAPIKMNFEILGNSVPHLHTHIVPRYLDDGEPGNPAHMMRASMENAPLIPEDRFLRDVHALKRLLT